MNDTGTGDVFGRRNGGQQPHARQYSMESVALHGSKLYLAASNGGLVASKVVINKIFNAATAVAFRRQD